MKYIKKYSVHLIFPSILLFLALFVLPNVVLALPGGDTEPPVGTRPPDIDPPVGTDPPETTPPTEDGSTGQGGGESDSDGQGGGKYKLTNPLESDDIGVFLGKVIDVLLIFALPIIILMIMYAGFLMVTAAGNPEKVSKGSKALLWAVVGGVIVLGAKVISEVIEGTIKDINDDESALMEDSKQNPFDVLI